MLVEKSLKRSLKVHRMQAVDFIGSSKIENSKVNWEKDVMGENINWLKACEIIIKKSKPISVFLSRVFNGEYSEINIQKKVGRHSLIKKTSAVSYIPVSYTHLDVYKRQALYGNNKALY